ncbi:MAG: transposase [Acaryochloris sp. RU_4_1]|nr:transposase [Acaryochloris sp. SU_5_25]NJM68229.1 transposase [Acaryochloris sp. RU_4_1]
MLTLTYRYRIYPDLQQELQMFEWLESCRKVYNYALRERKDWINSRKCSVNACSLHSEYVIPADAPYPDYYRQKKALTEAKKTNPGLKAVHSQVLQDVMGRVDAAFTAMKQRGHGLPRLKKFGQFKSFLFPQIDNDVIVENQIKLPKLGYVTINLHRPIPNGFKLKTARIIRKASGWYVAIAVQMDVSIPGSIPRGHALGIDVGVEYFLSTSDGEQVKRPRFFNQLHRKLELLQRRLKNKQKGSANRRKLNQKIAKVHEQISECRRDFHFQLAHQICDNAGLIFVEDLDFRIMAKGMLGKHTLDAGLGQFVNQILPWVCWKRDVYYGKVDPNGTSQECPDCGAAVKKDLSVRVHHCPECGSTKPRDIASGQVIQNRGLSAVGLIVDQIACGRDLSGALPRQDRVKQEALRSDLEKPALYA